MILRSLSIILIFCLLRSSIQVLDQTYFKILGINPSQTNKELIQKAYTQAKTKLQQSNAQKNQIQLLQEAYKVFSDNSLREKYQRYNSIAWKDLPKNTKAEEHDMRKGPLISLQVPITLEQIFNGGNISMKYTRRSACPKCQGYGFKNHSSLPKCNLCKGKGYQLVTVDTRSGFTQKRQQPCNRCKGVGKEPGTPCSHCQGKRILPEVADLIVPIEKGLPEGHTVILRNFGNERQMGAPSDLKLVFKQKNDGKWVRSKLNIQYSMEISLKQAIFGVDRQITHLDGRKFKIEIQGPITSSTRHTITGEGFASRKDKSKKGDLIIKPKIIFQAFSQNQLDLWEKVFNS